MYGFWGDCKYKKKCEEKPYSKLLENELLKEDYDNFYKNNRIEEKKNLPIDKKVDKLLNNNKSLEEQKLKSQEIISKFKTEKSSEIASKVLLNHL